MSRVGVRYSTISVHFILSVEFRLFHLTGIWPDPHRSDQGTDTSDDSRGSIADHLAMKYIIVCTQVPRIPPELDLPRPTTVASGHLNSDGEVEVAGVVPFNQYTSGSCEYQGFFSYSFGADRSRCRKACDRVSHCTHYAHAKKWAADANYCTLFNSCPTYAETKHGTSYSTHGHWDPRGDPGWPAFVVSSESQVVPSVYRCKAGCTGFTCAGAEWIELGRNWKRATREPK